MLMTRSEATLRECFENNAFEILEIYKVSLKLFQDNLFTEFRKGQFYY